METVNYLKHQAQEKPVYIVHKVTRNKQKLARDKGKELVHRAKEKGVEIQHRAQEIGLEIKHLARGIRSFQELT